MKQVLNDTRHTKANWT